MKQILFIAIILSIAYPAFSQDTIRYPYSCYMEWPMDSNMYYSYNYVKNERSACIIRKFRRNETYGREFYVNGPTKIYGIAATLWGQDTARRDLNVLLFSLNNTDVMPPKVLRWSDTLPYRYFVYEAIDCLPTSETYGKQFMEMVKAYEFYFDTPVVVTDTFFVGYHTLGVDGGQHPQCTSLTRPESPSPLPSSPRPKPPAPSSSAMAQATPSSKPPFPAPLPPSTPATSPPAPTPSPSPTPKPPPPAN